MTDDTATVFYLAGTSLRRLGTVNSAQQVADEVQSQMSKGKLTQEEAKTRWEDLCSNTSPSNTSIRAVPWICLCLRQLFGAAAALDIVLAAKTSSAEKIALISHLGPELSDSSGQQEQLELEQWFDSWVCANISSKEQWQPMVRLARRVLSTQATKMILSTYLAKCTRTPDLHETISDLIFSLPDADYQANLFNLPWSPSRTDLERMFQRLGSRALALLVEHEAQNYPPKRVLLTLQTLRGQTSIRTPYLIPALLRLAANQRAAAARQIALEAERLLIACDQLAVPVLGHFVLSDSVLKQPAIQYLCILTDKLGVQTIATLLSCFSRGATVVARKTTPHG